MRIGILTAALGGGGAERQALIWTRICESRGHDVTAIALWHEEGDPSHAGIRVLHLTKSSGGDLVRVIGRLRRLQSELDALVVFEPYLAVCAALAGLRIPWMLVTGKVPNLLREDTRIPMAAFRWAFNRATLASAPTLTMVEGHRRLKIRPKRPWLVIPNVTDADAFVEPAGQKAGVLWVGRLEPVKNPLLAVRSAVAARAPLTMLGYGRMQAEVEAAIAAEDATPPIELHPFGNDPWSIYARHRVLVVTSRYESFGNVIVESLAAGTPVVSVDCDFGPREILAQATYSRLTAPSVESVAGALVELLARPPSEAEAAECREIAARYRPEKIAPVIEATIERLAAA